MTLLALLGLWLLLLMAAVGAYEGARTLRRRELWRSIMAGLVGLGVRYIRREDRG